MKSGNQKAKKPAHAEGGFSLGRIWPGHGAKGANRTEAEREMLFKRMLTWLLIAASAFVPLIVYLKSIDLRGVMLTTWRGQTEHVDFFNWWKAAAIITIFVLLTVVHIMRWSTKKHTLEMPKRFLPLLVYLMFALLSAISSTLPEIALGGFTDRYEGLWVLLGYGMLAYSAFVLSRWEDASRMVLTALLCSTMVVAVIGFFQFMGLDFYQSSFGKRLILPYAYERFMDQLSFNFGKNIMYTTVYNPNYLGSYAALLMPVAWSWTYARKEKAATLGTGLPLNVKVSGPVWLPDSLKLSWRKHGWWAGIVFSFGLFILWLGSMSRAGLLGGGLAMLLFVLLQTRRVFRNPLPTVLLAASLIGAFLLLNATSGGLVLEEFKQTLPSRVQQSLGMVPVSEESVATGAETATNGAETTATGANAPAEEATAVIPAADAGVVADVFLPAIPAVTEVTLKDNRFKFATETETLEMVMASDAGTFSMRFFDGKGSPLTMNGTSVAGEAMRFTDARFSAYAFIQGTDYVQLTWYQYSFYFKLQDGKLAYVPKPYTYWTEVAPAAHLGFEGHERFATNRGWIWSRTLPLLGKSIFTGYGPDTFAAVFPQGDIAWKINLYGESNIVVDKPHNWYLQTAVNTGVVSMAMLIWLMLGFLLDALRVRFGRKVKGMAVLFGETVAMTETEGAGGSSISSGAPVPAGAPTGSPVDGNAIGAETVTLLMGILCGVAGYAVAGLFNDSVVSVAPIFWTVFGLGVGLLRNAPRAAEKPERSSHGRTHPDSPTH